MNILSIIDKYCRDNPKLRDILITHSRQVADKAVNIARRHPELNIDIDFLFDAAMIHDIGIVKTNAPGIECHGSEPYICHGIIGAKICVEEGLPQFANICERHTGAGITAQEVIQQNLPLPVKDYIPETIEEKLICYADKFFSKSHLDQEKTPEQVMDSLQKFGTDTVSRFKILHQLFKSTYSQSRKSS
mgnify:CR=1 FL=1